MFGERKAGDLTEGKTYEVMHQCQVISNFSEQSRTSSRATFSLFYSYQFNSFPLYVPLYVPLFLHHRKR